MKTMKKIFTLFSVLALFQVDQAKAQCDTTNVTGDLTISSSTFLSGVYYVTGTFKVDAAATVFVQKYALNGCGKLEVHAANVLVDGTINGDFAGFSGGTGGAPGQNVTSLTGDAASLTGCSNKDNTGMVQLAGGSQGTDGSGSGAGLAGLAGGSGSGPKQQCGSSSDDAGMIGGSGGAGGGAGASYGGVGSVGGNGGAGASTYSVSGVDISSAYPVVGGNGGNGGATGSTYGTVSGHDADLGSGGAGAGGGGRSYDEGLGGSNGGAGGGLVMLYATDSVSIAGTISVNGADGQAGGNGGNGGETAKCCSDGCDDCGEANLSTGSGAGAGAGAGSGGCIYVFADNGASITGTLSAIGGNGGAGGSRGTGTSCTYSGGFFCGDESISSNDGSVGQSGGAGGGGRIKLFVPICSQATVNPTTAIDGGTGYAAAQEGSYFLGCSELSVAENEAQVEVQVYPNPVSDVLQISVSGVNDALEIMLVDMSGRVLSNEQVNDASQLISIPVQDLNSGMYQVVVKSMFGTVNKRFIKK